MTRHRASAALLLAALLTACEKTAVQDITGAEPTSGIRFFNFGVNAPGVNFYANDAKVTAIGSSTGAEAVTGVAYGGVGLGGLYSSLQPGAYTFTGRIAAATDKDLPISTVQGTIENGKFYSLFMSGFYNTTTKVVEGFVVEDPVPAFDYTQAYVRFVNAISNSSPMTLYAKNATSAVEVAVGGLIAYKGAGTFVGLPAGTYDLNTRVSGSSTNAISRTGVAFAAGRVYTIGARGDITVVSTTATNRPFLDNTTNR